MMTIEAVILLSSSVTLYSTGHWIGGTALIAVPCLVGWLNSLD